MELKINSTTLVKVKSQLDMNGFVKALGLKSDVVLIKPNWVSGMVGGFTDAEVLDMFLTAVARPAVILESYTFWRTDKMAKGEGDYFSSQEATLEEGLKHWDFFKKQDALFLKTNGIDKVLKKYNAEYINITNEVWGKDVVDRETIRKEVEGKFPPVEEGTLYSVVPKKVYAFKDCDLVSFSKAKSDSCYGASLSIKNLFGLIPDPTRWYRYHGGDEERKLSQSIVDIHKVYQSLFKVKFVIEGVFTACHMDWGAVKSIPKYDLGFILGGKDGFDLDQIGAHLIGREFIGPIKNLPEKYHQVFGGNKDVDLDAILDEFRVKLCEK